MTRLLVIVAVVGAVLSAVSFGVAVSLAGGPLALADMSIRWTDDDGWERGWDHRHERRHGRGGVDGSGPETVRELAWTGGSELEVSVPADVRYVQGPDAKIVVRGPKGSVDNLRLDGDELEFDRSTFNAGRLQVTVTAPAINRFSLLGDQSLTLDNYRQDQLAIEIAGSGRASAKGGAKEVSLEISGSGDADLGGLQSERARVDISGSGGAVIAPTASAEIDIAGSGEVRLLTRPASVSTDIAGSGKVIQAGEGAAAKAGERI